MGNGLEATPFSAMFTTRIEHVEMKKGVRSAWEDSSVGTLLNRSILASPASPPPQQWSFVMSELPIATCREECPGDQTTLKDCDDSVSLGGGIYREDRTPGVDN